MSGVLEKYLNFIILYHDYSVNPVIVLVVAAGLQE